jgi:Na+/proline symporter
MVRELLGQCRDSGVEEFTLRHGGRGHGHGKFCCGLAGEKQIGCWLWLGMAMAAYASKTSISWYVHQN